MNAFDEAVKAFGRAWLRTLLVSEGGSVTRAARRAGRNRASFYTLLKRHDLTPAEFRVRKA